MFLKALKGLLMKAETEQDERNIPKWREVYVDYTRKRCIKCHLCVRYCPAIAINVVEEGFVKVDNEKCIRCAVCTEVCPTKALVMRR